MNISSPPLDPAKGAPHGSSSEIQETAIQQLRAGSVAVGQPMRNGPRPGCSDPFPPGGCLGPGLSGVAASRRTGVEEVGPNIYSES